MSPTMRCFGTFFGPFEGDDNGGWPQDETRIIAINEGRLVDFLTQHESRYRRLRKIVLAGLAGAAPEDGVATVNLNLRSVVASSPKWIEPNSIFDRLLGRLTAAQFWEACTGCDLRDRCYAHHNARTLMDPVAGPKVAERLRALYAITHLRGRLHVTMRDLRSAFAFTLAGTLDCDQIHALYETPGADSRREILNGFYFNAWQGGAGRRTACSRCWGRSTWARPPTRTSTVRWTICRRAPARRHDSRSPSEPITTLSSSNGGTRNSLRTRQQEHLRSG